jgi:phosphoglycolate phosphatase-like HAD superfamily hydrolase
MDKIEGIIYDFDGVICDSVNVKTEAFAELYRPFGKEIVNKVVEFHLAHGGVSRFEKFKYWHREYLGIVLDELGVAKLASQFSSLVFEKVINSNYIDGALQFIKENFEDKLQFICTGTPEVEIKAILKEKNIHQYFHHIYGSPKSKKDILIELLNKYELSSDQVVYFGDAMTDYEAANHINIKFIGINGYNFPDDIEQYESFSKMNNYK